MSDAMTFVLIYKVRGQLGIFLLDEVLYFLSQIAYDENEFVNPRFQKLVDDNRQDGLSCEWDQRLGLCISMWP